MAMGRTTYCVVSATVLTVTTVTVAPYVYRFARRKIVEWYEAQVSLAKNHSNLHVNEDNPVDDTKHKPGTTYQCSMVNALRNEFGYMTDSKANRLVLSRALTKMRGDCRKDHFAYHMPIIIELYFIPTKAEVDALFVRKSWYTWWMNKRVPRPKGVC